MEPVSLGVLAAVLMSKAAERAGERTVDAAEDQVGRFASWLRMRVTGRPVESTAVKKVDEVPDSPSRVQLLGEVLDQFAAADPDFAQELGAEVARAEAAGVDVRSIVQIAGARSVQLADVQGSTVTVSHGDKPPPPATAG